jgi:hypothetical protein
LILKNKNIIDFWHEMMEYYHLVPEECAMSERSYKKDLEVDKDRLDEEWERQTTLYIHWAEKEVEAQEERDKSQRRLNIIKAEMDAKVRSNPEKYGIEKISESAISHVVIQSKEYRGAELEYIESVKNAKILSAAVVAFDHKKRALTKLTDLYISGYYSKTGMPSGSREKVDEKRRAEQINKLNRKKEN